MAETKAKASSASPRKNTLRRVASVGPELAIVVRDAGRSGPASGKSVELAHVLNGDRKRAVQLILASGRKLKVPRERWEEVRGDLKTLVRDELAPLDAAAREEILDSISAVDRARWRGLLRAEQLAARDPRGAARAPAPLRPQRGEPGRLRGR